MKTTENYVTLYQDEHIVVVNKASGISVTSDRWNMDAPRLDLAAAEEFGKLYIVHRIDKDTSGIVVFARDSETHRTLSMAFESRSVQKIYHALVYGRPLWETKHCANHLRIDADIRHRTVVDNYRGKDAHTDFRLIGTCGPHYSWIEARPKTGRTHQIRVHLASLDLPIVCDSLYGNEKPVFLSQVKKAWRGDTFEERPLLARLALHAYRITFPHPKTGELFTVTAPYFKDMEACRRQFAKLFKVDPLAEQVQENKDLD